MDTLRRFPRTLAEAFSDSRAPAGDPRVMRAISRIGDEPPPSRWPFNPPEAASACSEFGHDDPPRPQTVSLLQRIKRRLRALAIKRLRP